jgi:arylsulfatase A-like enzyme
MYAAEISYQDRCLGEIMDYLRQQVDLDHTLVIITADHGENLGEAGRWEHLYAINDLLIHVPHVIRYPKQFPPGTRIKGLCELADLIPTVVEEAGLPLDLRALSGRSLRPSGFEPKLETVAQVWPYYLYLNKVEPLRGFERGLSDFLTQRRVLRTVSMKFVWSSDGMHQLYDITADPLETMNLAESMPELAQEFQQRLESRWASMAAYVPKAYDEHMSSPIDSRALIQLRSLGYVGD